MLRLNMAGSSFECKLIGGVSLSVSFPTLLYTFKYEPD